jgi:hypothetical protein
VEPQRLPCQNARPGTYHRCRPSAGVGGRETVLRWPDRGRSLAAPGGSRIRPVGFSRRSACRHQASARPRSARSTPRTPQVRNGPSRRHGSIANSATAATTRARSAVAGISPRAASRAALRSRSGRQRRRRTGSRPWIPTATTNAVLQSRGFALPPAPAHSEQDGLEQLLRTVERLRAEDPRLNAPVPVLGLLNAGSGVLPRSRARGVTASAPRRPAPRQSPSATAPAAVPCARPPNP